MKLKITTLVIVEEGQVENIYHSLEDNQDKAYQEIINQVNAEYGDGGVLQFYSLRGIKEYFEIVHIQTQELTSIGFKTAILDLWMKKKSKNQVYIPHQDKWNEHFPTPGKPNPNYYTDSGATFNKHLRTQNKLKQKRKWKPYY